MAVKPTYYEEQRFNQKWLIILLSLLLLLFAGLAFLLVFQRKTGIFIAIIPFCLVLLLAVLFGRILRLQIQIGDDEIQYRFYPLQRRFRIIGKAEVSSIDVRTYDPIGEYGGWGIRYGRKGMAYTVKGNHGIGVVMTSGKKILLGTGQPEEVKEVLKQNHWV